MKNVITFPPRLDDSSGSFLDKLPEQLSQGAILDLSSVRYFDFNGAKLLLASMAKLPSLCGQKLYLYAPQPKLAALLSFMQFDKLIPFTPSLTPTSTGANLCQE